jgi:hypothetical protein
MWNVMPLNAGRGKWKAVDEMAHALSLVKKPLYEDGDYGHNAGKSLLMLIGAF